MKNLYYIQKEIGNLFYKYKIYENDLFYEIISLLLKINKNEIYKLIVRNGCLLVYTDNFLYKIKIYGNTIREDLKNRKKIFVDCKFLLSPIQIYRKIPLVIRMPILKSPIKYDKPALYIWDKMKNVSYEKDFKLIDFPLIVKGIKILQRYKYGEMVRKKLDNFFYNQEGKKIRVGIVHGDFHRGNIMQFGDKYVLIDFNRARNNDIQAIDMLYYILEEVRCKHRYAKNWLEEWIFIFENIPGLERDYWFVENLNIGLTFGLVVLLLERLGQEEYEHFFVERKVFDRINKMLLNRIVL